MEEPGRPFSTASGEGASRAGTAASGTRPRGPKDLQRLASLLRDRNGAWDSRDAALNELTDLFEEGVLSSDTPDFAALLKARADGQPLSNNRIIVRPDSGEPAIIVPELLNSELGPQVRTPWTAAAKTGTEAVAEGGGARGREKKVGGGTRRRRSERGGRRRRQGITERAESDAQRRGARVRGMRASGHATTSPPPPNT